MSSEVPREAILVFPPQWIPQNPPFALACLGGHLRSRGIPLRLVDLNLEWYLELLTPQAMAFSKELTLSRREFLAQKVHMHLMVGSESPTAQQDAAHFMKLEDALHTTPDPWAQASLGLARALHTLRDRERFYQPEHLVDALKTIDSALSLASLPYFPSRLALNDYYNPQVHLTMPSLEKATVDSWTNMFLRFLRERGRRLLARKPALIAISINAFSQVLPGLTLARYVKEHAGPSTHVTVGGNFFGRLTHRLLELPRFFELFCHTLLIGEGEQSLERLARAILEERPPLDTPRCLFLQDGKVSRAPAFDAERIRLQDVGFLDLEGLSLSRYLGPEPVICIQGSRGCYWGRCSFCDSYWGVPLDEKTPPRVVAEMRHLRDRYGIRHFEFIDECMPPEGMAALAGEIRKAGLHDVRWFANARTEPGFVEHVDDLVQGGLTMLLWGFESGSEPILRRIMKGVHPDGRWDILGRAAAAGVWNFAYIFFGFPGETRDDALATIRAICDHTDVIHSYGRSVFSLGRHSPIAETPERFGVSDITEEGEDLSVNIAFKSAGGPTDAEVTEFSRLCTQMCREAYGSPLWMVLRNRENLHLYVARHGVERVRAWSVEDLGLDEELTRFQK